MSQITPAGEAGENASATDVKQENLSIIEFESDGADGAE